jgi:hypothetical protein
MVGEYMNGHCGYLIGTLFKLCGKPVFLLEPLDPLVIAP